MYGDECWELYRIAGKCKCWRNHSLPAPRGGTHLAPGLDSHSHTSHHNTPLTTLVTISRRGASACPETVKSFARGEIMGDTLSHILTTSNKDGLEGSEI